MDLAYNAICTATFSDQKKIMLQHVQTSHFYQLQHLTTLFPSESMYNIKRLIHVSVLCIS